jgi:hypothetical protein
LKVELDKLTISVVDVQHTIKVIDGIRQRGYRVNDIIMAVSNWENFGKIQAELQNSVRELTVSKGNLQEECAELDRRIFVHRQKESLFNELQEMGCGLKELKLIFGIIKEVADNRQIPANLAVQKFFEDIEKNYDNKLGYDSALERLRTEIEKTNMELSTLQFALGKDKKVVRALSDVVTNT